MQNLTSKQERFVHEFIIDFNATQAAIRAGYSPRTAAVIASQNLRKLNIKKAVTELSKQKMDELGIKAEYIIGSLKEIAERCMKPKQTMIYNPETRHKEPLKDAYGNYFWEIDSRGANRALELLGKYLGLFDGRGQKILEDTKKQSNVIIVANPSK